MTWFWVAATAMAAVAALPAVAALRRAAGGPADASAAAGAGADIDVYRRQLAELDRDLARGVLMPEEAQRLRTEIARRMLAADARLRAEAGTAGADRPVSARMVRGPAAAGAALVLVATVGGGIAAYLYLGAPGYPDLPLAARLAAAEAAAAARPSQAAAEAAAPPLEMPEVPADFLSLMEALRARLAERPGDVVGLRLLAENEARLGRFAAAHAAQARLLAALGAGATAADHGDHARYLIAAAGGIVTAEAEAALEAALARDPGLPEALFFRGVAWLQTGRPDRAFPLWRRYLEVAPDGHPYLAEVEGGIAQLAALAGVRYTPPPPRAPDAGALAAGRAMTEQLAARLAEEGGPAEDWARLIRALRVLGEDARARAIVEEAQARFAGRQEDLALIAAAAGEALE